MSELADNFESQAITRFSQGPEMDTSVAEAQVVDVLLNELPPEMRELIETMDVFTQRRFMDAYETQLEAALDAGIEIGEDAALYGEAYERYGWQYDE